MAKTPKVAPADPPRDRRSRHPRSVAPVHFEDSDEISGGAESNDDAVGDISIILKEHHERQAKKTSARASAFQMQNKAVYAAARKAAQDVSKAGIVHIEHAVARMQELRKQEVSPEKAFANYEQLLRVQEEGLTSLLSMYPPLVNDLATRRSEEVNAASEMQQRNPSRRETALRNFSRNARLHVEEARQNEKAATDASELIKHYKSLLRA
ncbi:hypothetical protein H2248_009227 [Termitomyces sp. 'cryptogamus']|nr:hypothetical protein H2248_009227 [Termitomyces sp. 'cryptogamus']